MKKLITILFVFFSMGIRSQVFSGAAGAILDNGQDTYFPINVSGLSGPIDSVYGLQQVCLTINHPLVSELYIYLQSPSGTNVELTLGSSSNGSDLINTCFDDQAGSSVTLGTAPYTGSFKPVGFLGRFNTSQVGNGTWNLIVHDGFPGMNAGNLVSCDITFGNSPAHPVIFNSSNLPIVIINAAQPITDLKTVVNMGVIYNGANRNYVTDPANNYNGKAQIHLHGSSTKVFEKKSYNIETQDNAGNALATALLGMPTESDWILSASYADKTLIRIPFTYDLFRSMGHYASRHKNVEVILNNEYRGIYCALEKIKQGVNRVNIKKLGPLDNYFPDVTGGYIVQIDRTDAAGWYSQFPGDCPANTNFYYQYIYPKDTLITVPQKNYIQGALDTFETVMNSANYKNPVTGYAKYIDVNSFVDFFIVNELSKNVDGYRLSTYMYKDDNSKGGKLHIGPVWDYDIAWHNCNYGNTFNTFGWEYQLQANDYPSPTWWSRFMQDSNFVNKLHCRWFELRQNILSINRLNNYIDSSANALNESQQRNFRQWPTIGAFIYPNPQNQTGANYWGEVADLKNWILNRSAWLDANIFGNCSVGIKEQFAANNLIVYPNPMERSATFSMQLESPAEVSLCIMDVTGKEVARILNSNLPPGDSKIVFEKNQIEAGIYSYQLQINNTVTSGKIVIQ